MTEVTDAMCAAGRDVQRTWTHDLLTPDRFRAIYLAMEAALEAARIPAPAPDVERLSEALFHLSDLLRASEVLSQTTVHAAYEKVVAAFQALSAIPIPAPTGEVERALREALGPILDWYQSDEHEDRPTVEIVRDVVADLQQDRALALKVRTLRLAGANLSVCAQTSGGTAGPDAGLMLAIRQWQEAEAPVRAALTDHTTKDDLTEQGEK